MRKIVAASAVLLLISAQGWASKENASESSSWSSSIRLRYADVQQTEESGAAVSALARVGWLTQWWENWQALIETDFVARGLRSQHSDGVDGNGEPVIPDPDGADLNQLFVEQQLSFVHWRLGRQRIDHGNQRFVGGNAFWQNEQTFDAATLHWQFAESSSLQYAYVNNVNRIFGENATAHLNADDDQYGQLYGDRPQSRLGDHHLRSHWLFLQWREWDYQRISLYWYGNEYPEFEEWSHRTAGIRHEWDFKWQQWRWRTQLECALQNRFDESDANTTRYTLAELTVGSGAWEVAWRDETLGSHNDIAFITPLGSVHDFHGVLDLFSETPGAGLHEQSARLSWRHSPWLIELRYAQFEAAAVSLQYGDEVDLTVRWRQNRQQSVMLTAGRFNADAASDFSDERRVYLDYRYEFSL